MTYASLLAFYLYLRASTKYSARPELLREHPILKRLLTLKQSLTTLEDLGFNASDSEDDSGSDDLEDDESDELDSWLSTGKLELNELEELLAEEAAAGAKKAKKEDADDDELEAREFDGDGDDDEDDDEDGDEDEEVLRPKDVLDAILQLLEWMDDDYEPERPDPPVVEAEDVDDSMDEGLWDEIDAAKKWSSTEDIVKEYTEDLREQRREGRSARYLAAGGSTTITRYQKDIGFQPHNYYLSD